MKKLFFRHSKNLFAISLSLFLSGCGGQLPRFPEIYQCAFSATQNAFFCVNTKTEARVKIPASDARMRGAQCMSLADYRKSEQWVGEVKKLAETRCR